MLSRDRHSQIIKVFLLSIGSWYSYSVIENDLGLIHCIHYIQVIVVASLQFCVFEDDQNTFHEIESAQLNISTEGKYHLLSISCSNISYFLEIWHSTVNWYRALYMLIHWTFNVNLLLKIR